MQRSTILMKKLQDNVHFPLRTRKPRAATGAIDTSMFRTELASRELCAAGKTRAKIIALKAWRLSEPFHTF
jgi:hypothetical protein